VRRLLFVLLSTGCLESIDVGDPNDSGPGDDAGTIDTGTIDTGTNDSGTTDTGSNDSGLDSGMGFECMTDFRNRVIVPPPTGDAAFFQISAMGFDAQGFLYVLSQGYITRLGPAPTHEVELSYGRGDIGFARGIAVAADGTSYVSDWGQAGDVPAVVVFNSLGTLVDRFETTEPNMVNDQALGIAIDDQDTLYIGGLVLFRYRTDGTFVDYFGVEGFNPGEVMFPVGLAWDPTGFLWVADLFRNYIHQYDLSTGSQRIEFGGRGTELGTFDGTAPMDEYWGPTRIVLDSDGDVYVNDPWSSRVQKFDRFGGSLGEFSFGGSRAVDALAIEPMSGNLYVSRGDAIDILCPF
jgi:sugar lactone lactonase YvrE